MGFKRATPNIIERLRAGSRYGAATTLAAFGVFSAAGALLFPAGWLTVDLMGVCSISAGAVSAWIAGKKTHVPSLLLDELSADGGYACQPCSAANLRIATEMVRPLFGREHIDFNVLEQWRLRNPQGFMEIIDSANELVACFVVVALSDSFMQEFKSGRVTEQDITSDIVLDMKNTKKKKEIYISGVMVKDPNSYKGAKRARYLIWAMLIYVKHHFGLTATRSFYAIPITRESGRLVKELGFSVASHGASRKDKHDCYLLELDVKKWQSLLVRVGDLRKNCKIRYPSK